MPSDLTLGAEYNYDGLEDEVIGYERYMKQKVRIAGTYLQNEWKNERWSLLVGGRLDKHNLVDHVIFSPRANLRFNPNRSINLRASYAGGFRAPQAFDEDLHVSLVGGERLVTRLADNLKEERSNSFSVSADLYHTFGNVQTNLLIEGFYTDLNDVFSTRKLAQPDAQGNEVQERYNAYGAKVYGLNIEGKAAYASWLELQAGVTLQKVATTNRWNGMRTLRKRKRCCVRPICMAFHGNHPSAETFVCFFFRNLYRQYACGACRYRKWSGYT